MRSIDLRGIEQSAPSGSKEFAREAFRADGALDHPVDAIVGGDRRRASLLLEDAVLNEAEDVSASDSGAVLDASVPGISCCCARITEASKKTEQLTL